MKKEFALLFVSLGIVSLLVVGVGEIALRIRYGDRALPRELGGGYPVHLVMRDEKMGHTLTPGFRGRQVVLGEPDVELRINRWGLRDYERELTSSEKVIIVLGDSFAFGHGVPFEKIWPTLLENKIRASAPEYSVLKAGVPGFGWRQYLQQYKRLLPHLGLHPLVIVAFTVDAGERITNGYVVKGGVLVKRKYPNLVAFDGLVYEKASRHEAINRIDASLRRRSYFFRWFNLRIAFVVHQFKRTIRDLLKDRPLEKNSPTAEVPDPASRLPLSKQRHIRHATAVLNSIHKKAMEKEAELLVLFITHPRVWADEIDFYEEFLSEKGIPSLDLSEVEGTSASSWRLKDGHWNALGNQEVAEIVTQFIQEYKLLESTKGNF